MLNTLVSTQQSTHLSPAPLSLSFNTNEDNSIDTLSTLFLTLVYFLKEDNELDDASTKGACEFLNKIDSKCPLTVTPEQLLHRLVPTADGTCSKFAEHLVVILTCGNVDLADSLFVLVFGETCPNRPRITSSSIDCHPPNTTTPAFTNQQTHL
ncbi:hypothetical protein BLNAU_24198 [Blattamonas nauphoetae]|uniref:Uncharacterized protein n=1 Tax=Blattamonas nauphoetae TaxID=2049346 RepID=A0ABQ9WN48_9EUKA|nr:hypothetical protein BLNAU_24198 [Blattamonas nauphoetae]